MARLVGQTRRGGLTFALIALAVLVVLLVAYGLVFSGVPGMVLAQP